VLAAGLLATSVGMPATQALTSLERPREIFWTVSAAAVLTTLLVWRLTSAWGLVGAAYGFLLGNIIGAAERWIALRRHAGEAGLDQARRVHARKLMFAERVLLAFVETIEGREDRRRLLDEVQACTQLHLEAIEVFSSPQGLWRRLLRRSAARKIATTLEGMRRESISLPFSPADALATRQ
jgi:hypothetical protein